MPRSVSGGPVMLDPGGTTWMDVMDGHRNREEFAGPSFRLRHRAILLTRIVSVICRCPVLGEPFASGLIFDQRFSAGVG